ncbi:MAG: SEC-C domain-containing protein, partial [Anaerolineales bacterium]|nr:SEC-C domain-containing protein [Anaerolineales bacterium]
SFQMFQNMRANIDEAVAQRYFVDLQNHQTVLAREESFAAVREQLSQAGYQVVQRQNGKGAELRRDAPKVGRNDPCPCGSGKKYKHCHMKQDEAARRGRAPGAAGRQKAATGKKKGRRK